MRMISDEMPVDRSQEIVDLISKGQGTIKKASEVYGLSREGIRKICFKSGVNKKTARLSLQKNVADCVAAGTAKSDVYAKFGVNSSFVKDACSAHGVPFTAQGCGHEQTIEILSDLINSRESLANIAKRHSVSPYLVSRIYARAVSQGIFIQERKTGRTPKEVRRSEYRVCIPLDNVIDGNVAFFSFLTNSLFSHTEIHIIASSFAGKKEDLLSELDSKSIKYHFFVVEDDRAGYIDRMSINVYFESEDTHLKDLPSSVTVFKTRDDQNFCFESQKWLYSAITGESC